MAIVESIPDLLNDFNRRYPGYQPGIRLSRFTKRSRETQFMGMDVII